MMFEPGSGEAFEVPCNIATFHDHELVQNPNAALAASFHREWLESGGKAPGFDECVGFKRPFFLGGEDNLGNVELSNIDVYWHLFGQLIAKTRGLPPGTRVNINLS